MTVQKKKKSHSKSTSKQGAQISNQVGLFFKVALLSLMMLMMLVFGVFYIKYGHLILQMQSQAKSLVWSSDEATFRQYGTSMFFDVKGKLISSLSGERELYYVKYEDVPSQIVDAVVTIEDKRYFEHQGVDYIANLRAAVALIQNDGKVTQGASTITQQLARNIFLSNEVTVERKLKEIFIASELEKKYSKKQILEFYLNNIYYANGYYGIQAAANGYFGKSISSLSLSEVAFLAAIPNSPSYYDPVKSIDNTYKRRDRILLQMYEDGLINQSDYKSAKREKIKVKKQSYDIHNYVETYVYQCTIEELMKQSGFVFCDTFESDEVKEAYDKSYQELYNQCQNKLYTGGYRVYTSIDLSKQNKLQEAVDEKLAAYTEQNEDGVYKLQGSAVCIENETGLVTAIVGGRSQNFSIYTLNRAYQSYRQPGSAIKPLVVYTPYFEDGHEPEELVMDEKTEEGPKNSNGTYLGEIDLRTAIEQSTNTVAWNLFEKLTPKRGLSYLKQMNFKKISIKDEVLAASLGGFTYGTNTLEMAAAYRAIENKGIYRQPTCILKIMNAAGELVVSTEANSKVVYNSKACLIMTDTLKGVMTKGTGKGQALTDMVSAGKTGTTTDKKDGWFCGYTPYYTTSVWVGYDYPQPMSDLYGNTYPGSIWKEFMETIHEGMEPKEFETYATEPENDEFDENDIEEENQDNEELEDEDQITDNEGTEPIEPNEDSNQNGLSDTENGTSSGIDGDNELQDDYELTDDPLEEPPEDDDLEEEIPEDDDSEEKQPEDEDEEDEADSEDDSLESKVPDESESSQKPSQDDVYYSNGDVYYKDPNKEE